MATSLKSATKGVLRQVIPASWEKNLRILSARRVLSRVPHQPCGSAPLLPASQLDLPAIWHNDHIAADWARIAPQLNQLVPPSARGGVNPGDRKALFHLLRALKPAHVLEVGTHVGFSTLHIAAALNANDVSANDASTKARLTTVDILDVNDPVKQPWRAYGLEHSPQGLLDAAGYAGHTQFVTSGSLEFLEQCDERFDFIFLDGSHAAPVVYQEVPKAISALNPGGVILLHDYYTNLEWLWENKNFIPGPCLAIQRLQAEGADLKVVPLGELPWPTKENSNITSLALLVRA
ncbi:MAG: class I SAM-dependent methyltransferase [Cyanobacteria bacterium P01_G01_bin.38]